MRRAHVLANSSMSKSSPSKLLQCCTGIFWELRHSQHIVKVLNELVRQKILCLKERLNTIQHTILMNALDCRALCFANSNLTTDHRDSLLLQMAHPHQATPTTTDKINSKHQFEIATVQPFLQQWPNLLAPICIVPGSKGEGIGRLFIRSKMVFRLAWQDITHQPKSWRLWISYQSIFTVSMNTKSIFLAKTTKDKV